MNVEVAVAVFGWCAMVPLLIYSPPIAWRPHTCCNSCSR